MAYTKTVWKDYPDTTTKMKAQKLNNIENGIEDVDTRLTTAEGEINNAEAVIGNETDTYSASSTYALGSLVIYDGLLNKCTTAITVAEAWTIAHWTQVSLTSLANDGDVYSTSEQIVGKWIDGKTIYRKVLKGTTTASIDILLGSIPNLDTLIDIRGVTGGGYIGGTTWVNLSISPQQFRQVYVTSEGAVRLIQQASEETPYRIILEYTKTTD